MLLFKTRLFHDNSNCMFVAHTCMWLFFRKEINGEKNHKFSTFFTFLVTMPSHAWSYQPQKKIFLFLTHKNISNERYSRKNVHLKNEYGNSMLNFSKEKFKIWLICLKFYVKPVNYNWIQLSVSLNKLQSQQPLLVFCHILFLQNTTAFISTLQL